MTDRNTMSLTLNQAFIKNAVAAGFKAKTGRAVDEHSVALYSQHSNTDPLVCEIYTMNAAATERETTNVLMETLDRCIADAILNVIGIKGKVLTVKINKRSKPMRYEAVCKVVQSPEAPLVVPTMQTAQTAQSAPAPVAKITETAALKGNTSGSANSVDVLVAIQAMHKDLTAKLAGMHALNTDTNNVVRTPKSLVVTEK